MCQSDPRGRPGDISWVGALELSIKGTPKNGWFIVDNPMNMDDLGVNIWLVDTLLVSIVMGVPQ